MKQKPEKIRQILAQNIKKRRESLGMTQENLAENANLSVQTINTIESSRMWISDKSITRLAKALDIEIFQLFMPHRIDIEELDTGQGAILLELWQKMKLVLDKMDSQIDQEFREVLQHPLQKYNEREAEVLKPVADKPRKNNKKV
jgi:transcriptional regulator with XRE-family HTH domain